MLQSSGTLAQARGCPPAFHHSQTTRLSSFLRTWCFSNNLFHTQLLPSLPAPQLLPGTSCLPLRPPPHGASTSPLSLSLKHSLVHPLTQPPPPESLLALRTQASPNGESETKGASMGSHSTTSCPGIQAGGLLSGIRDSCGAPLYPTAPRSWALGTSLSPSHPSTACDSMAWAEPI